MAGIEDTFRQLVTRMERTERRVRKLEVYPLAAGGGGGVDAFVELTDTPASYVGEAGKFVQVNAGATALEFDTVAWADIASKPSTFAPSGHAASHQHDGTDEIATATAAANAIPKAGAGGKLAVGWLPTGSGNGLDADTVDGSHASAFAVAAHTHDDRYYTETELNTSAGGGAVHWDNVTNPPSTYAPSSHAASHKHSGADEIATATPTANAIPKAGASGKLDGAWVDLGTLDHGTLSGLGDDDHSQYLLANGTRGTIQFYADFGIMWADMIRANEAGLQLTDEDGNTAAVIVPNGTTPYLGIATALRALGAGGFSLVDDGGNVAARVLDGGTWQFGFGTRRWAVQLPTLVAGATLTIDLTTALARQNYICDVRMNLSRNTSDIRWAVAAGYVTWFVPYPLGSTATIRADSISVAGAIAAISSPTAITNGIRFTATVASDAVNQNALELVATGYGVENLTLTVSIV